MKIFIIIILPTCLDTFQPVYNESPQTLMRLHQPGLEKLLQGQVCFDKHRLLSITDLLLCKTPTLCVVSLLPSTSQHVSDFMPIKQVEDYTWARMGMAESDVELFVHSDFKMWNMTHQEIQQHLLASLRLYGIVPKYFKPNHLQTGKLFIVMHSLREAYELMELVINASIGGQLDLPAPLTIDFSHSQLAIFQRFFGGLPDKYEPWPHQMMSVQPIMTQPTTPQYLHKCKNIEAQSAYGGYRVPQDSCAREHVKNTFKARERPFCLRRNLEYL